ncbi:PDDEXK nuclease domain-containing protein [Pedobacter sp. 22163]|uniref:PDDEXK nuclease domain-containing protein n=1 Tax=Pedobacter sp. 22163 TaxID=3453883 RepID=UPI003F8593EA
MRYFTLHIQFVRQCLTNSKIKIGELKHQDIGQMQMYVNYFDREVKLEDENKTIGIILCQDKSESVVRYTLPENNEQIFASKYLTVLPSEKDFIKIIEN